MAPVGYILAAKNIGNGASSALWQKLFSSGLLSSFENDIGWDDHTSLNLALLVILSSSLGALIIALFVVGIYFICLYAANDTSYFPATNFQIPGNSAEDQRILREEEERYLPLMPKLEQQSYTRGKQYEEEHPPNITTKFGKLITPTQQQAIDDRGLDAFFFKHDSESLNPRFVVEDKTDITFTSNEASCVQLNLPLPIKSRERDTIYFEVKLFDLPGYDSSKIDTSKLEFAGDFDRSECEASKEPVFAIGLATQPYPNFRLPGYNKYSISYENNGRVRINRPFDNSPCIFPKLSEGDVVGVGFRPADGSVFYTRNGKKLFDILHGMRLNLFPVLGAVNCMNYKFQVNLGQLGFVFIEANVKKWGLAKNFGTLGAPPAYGNNDEEYTVIDQGEPIPPSYPSEEEDFFGNLIPKPTEKSHLLAADNHSNYNGISTSQRQPDSLISGPPSYSSRSTTASQIKEMKSSNLKDESEYHNTPDSHVNLRERLYERQSTEYGYEDESLPRVSSSSIPHFNYDVNDGNEGTSAQFLKTMNANTSLSLNVVDPVTCSSSATGSLKKSNSLANIDTQLANTNNQHDTTIITLLTSNTSSGHGTENQLEEHDSITFPSVSLSTSPKSPISPGGSKKKKKGNGKKRRRKQGKKSGTTF